VAAQPLSLRRPVDFRSFWGHVLNIGAADGHRQRDQRAWLGECEVHR
jgi:hypothetical protein